MRNIVIAGVDVICGRAMLAPTAQKEIFQKYIECSDKFAFRMMELAFREGFCLGGRLSIEVMEQRNW